MDALTYTEAFYGGRIPESKKNVASIEIVKLVAIVKNDLRLEYPHAESEILDEGVLSVLNSMRQLGASSPKIYYEKTELVIQAFQAGMERVKILCDTKTTQQEREQYEKDRQAQREVRLPVQARIMADFEKHQQRFIAEGADAPKLEAWKCLIDNIENYDLSGIGYYIINMKIPQEIGYYHHEDIIEICNTHPRLIDRKPPRMQVNGENWNGKAR